RQQAANVHYQQGMTHGSDINQRTLQVVGLQSSVPRHPGQHARPYFLGVVEREHDVRPTRPLKNAMRAGGSLDAPSDPQQRRENAPRPRGRPLAQAATNRLSSSGARSPCSRRSAITRRARASALASASTRVAPYASTPGSSTTSPIQRPSASSSSSTVSGRSATVSAYHDGRAALT